MIFHYIQKNWFQKRSRIYSNYHLYKIPYFYIDSIDKMTIMHEGHAILDEMWTIANARTTTTKMNRLVSDIILRSRKRDLTYIFTTQLLDLLDKRVRKILDFTAYPVLNREETILKCFIFRGGYPKENMLLKSFLFRTPLIMDCFDTNEEIDMKEDDDGKEPKIVFQEDKNTPPKYFDTYEDADKFATAYWEKNRKLLSLLFGG